MSFLLRNRRGGIQNKNMARTKIIQKLYLAALIAAAVFRMAVVVDNVIRIAKEQRKRRRANEHSKHGGTSLHSTKLSNDS